MFEQMLKEMIVKIIENDESVQDVIRKQATTDIFEAIEDDIDRKIVDAIDELVIVRR